MSKRNQAAPAEAEEAINWAQLLLGRKCPPPPWWVGLAQQRRSSATEVRASAVAHLLAIPLELPLGPPPYLQQLPVMVKSWLGLVGRQEQFIAMGADSDAMRTAVFALLTASAAVEAMDERPAAARAGAAAAAPEPLVPELLELRRAAGALIEAMVAAGIPLEARHYVPTAQQRQQLAAEVDAVNAKRAAATAAAAPAEAPAAPPPRKRPPARPKQQQAEPPPAASAPPLKETARNDLLPFL